MRAVIVALAVLTLAACQSAAPVDRPCGVIVDSLKDVRATTPEGDRRIDKHFERGVAAGCWGRR